ncbi:MAG: alpha/beta hydrolase, partial [Desulfovibrio sp.]|nr:alpha/beta hydrolase [Desulfovibrio sp.]
TLLFILALGPKAAFSFKMQSFPVPTTVSPQLQKYITSTPLFPYWKTQPENPAQWEALIQKVTKANLPALYALQKKLAVQIEPKELSGVKVYLVTPKTIAKEHQGRILLHFHPGGYVFNPGLTGTHEALIMAAQGKVQVLSVDYRMPPAHPYPCALDDALSVYRELLKTYPCGKIGVFGSSAGGGLTLALALKIKALGLPQPAALAPSSPWSDLDKIGDTYFTNEGLDNVIVSYDSWLSPAAKLYANGHDLRDPYLSPIYGDLSGLPPVFLTSGTRDLFLSNTVRLHLKLRAAAVPAELLVFEGMSHVQFIFDPEIPEVRQHFHELSHFFAKHWR